MWERFDADEKVVDNTENKKMLSTVANTTYKTSNTSVTDMAFHLFFCFGVRFPS